MDKVFSARLDESVIQQISLLSRKLHASKKAVIEAAITSYSKQSGLKEQVEVFEHTCGAWERSESPPQSVSISRAAFNQSIERRQR